MAQIHLTKATYLKRLNRFVSLVGIDGKEEKIYVPNTGRLSELAISGTRVLLSPSYGRYRYKLQFMYYKGDPVFIESVRANNIFARFLSLKEVPEMKDISIIQSEPTLGSHRFDFLLQDAHKNQFYTEIKCCTLAWRKIASFPDAVSARASSHIEHLAQEENSHLIFIIMHQHVEFFTPNFHTDFHFYETLKKHHNTLTISAYKVKYSENMEVESLAPVPVIIPEVKPKGVYIILLYNPECQRITVGSLGDITFQPGYYLYTGSGKSNLFKRIKHHRARKKSRHWHMDYITPKMKIKTDLPVVSEVITECMLAENLQKMGGEPLARFGSTDCSCNSHLFYFKDNPSLTEKFWDWILEMRFGGVHKQCNTPRPEQGL